jgi:anthranilate synthase component 1
VTEPDLAQGPCTVALEPLDDADLLHLHRARPDHYPVLLESVAASATIGRHDVLLALPGERLMLQPDGRLEGPPDVIEDANSFLQALDRWIAREPSNRGNPALPFVDGWFLYLGYELAAQIEPSLRLPRSRLPTAIAWRMGGLVLRDRRDGTCRVHADSPAHATELAARVHADLTFRQPPDSANRPLLEGQLHEEPPEVFLQGVRDLLEAIGRGDVYQANLSRGWRAQLAAGIDVGELYARLRHANPAPFAGSARLPGFAVLSSSPERLVELRDGIASTRPIAGTRPRGADSGRDQALREELRLDAKEQAEHVMLVDLERNDLGRICEAGTVQVDEYMTIESYAHVHHIVSNVRGQLRAGVTPGQAIAAVFPGGTITGCPKVRCMQLLAQFELEPRDAYTGSFGFLDRQGRLDLNILIRTLTVVGRELGFRTGAGIVADSNPEAELRETRAKALGLLRALGADAAR